MKVFKKVAFASLVGASMLAGTSFAGPAAMQTAADAEALVIAKAVNNNASISCKQAALRIGNKAKANAGKTKGKELHAAILNSITLAAKKAKIDVNCVTAVVASNATSTLTGLANSGKTLGLAKAGAGTSAGAGLLGLGGVAGAAGVSTAVLAAGGLLVGGAVLADINDSDSNNTPVSASTM